jgi:hypothetical protein
LSRARPVVPSRHSATPRRPYRLRTGAAFNRSDSTRAVERQAVPHNNCMRGPSGASRPDTRRQLVGRRTRPAPPARNFDAGRREPDRHPHRLVAHAVHQGSEAPCIGRRIRPARPIQCHLWRKTPDLPCRRGGRCQITRLREGSPTARPLAADGAGTGTGLAIASQLAACRVGSHQALTSRGESCLREHCRHCTGRHVHHRPRPPSRGTAIAAVDARRHPASSQNWTS